LIPAHNIEFLKLQKEPVNPLLGGPAAQDGNEEYRWR
jgi:hypothetical protein